MAADSPVDVGTLITRTSGVQGGKPCLAGTRIRVQTIATMAAQGLDANGILSELPHLDLARIHAALAYYYANRDDIEGDLAAERQLGDELARKYPHGWTSETDQP